MKGIDTNVLLAWLIDEKSRHLKKDEVYRVNLVTLVELAWVLDRSFKRTRNEIAETIDGLLTASELSLQEHDVVDAAVRDYRNGPADFADYLIGRENLKAGCETTLTFDRKAARHSAFTLAA
jgi:predicted nucleic-acid-binding protein